METLNYCNYKNLKSLKKRQCKGSASVSDHFGTLCIKVLKLQCSLNYPLKCSVKTDVEATLHRCSQKPMFLETDVLKICCKFVGEHPCRSTISIKLLCSFTEITLWHGCSPENLQHIFRTLFHKNTYVRVLLQMEQTSC